MLDEQTLLADLRSMGLGAWEESVLPIVRDRLRDGAHGHLARWQEVLAELPDTEHLRELLLVLAPWRKGPFELRDVRIDAEWRSDMKWRRLANRIEPLGDRLVLDVGSGNGWYALRMRDAGARRVLGVDPMLLYVAQFEAVRRLTGASGVHILPVGLEDLPQNCRAFDTSFSMGVLYHRRAPADHLAQLRGTLRVGGQLVLETLIYPGEGHAIVEPPDRYARMRNVWHLPTIPTLVDWVRDAGFENCELIDETATTVEEQRSTCWMPFESLAEALDPEDQTLTIEGMPAPVRAIITANAT